jgi:hypothetical protein
LGSCDMSAKDGRSSFKAATRADLTLEKFMLTLMYLLYNTTVPFMTLLLNLWDELEGKNSAAHVRSYQVWI